MLFNSLVFFLFLGIVLAVYPRLPRRGQNVFLLVASYVFYGYWDWRFNFLLLGSTLLDFFVGRQLAGTEDSRRRRLLLGISLIGNLGILGFFKYFNFFIDSFAALLASTGLEPNLPTLKIILPVGISFYTFQTLSYTIDIYRRRLQPVDSLVDFALFVSFFPQLVAGPIERASNLLPQIVKPRSVNRRLVITGLNLMLIGYFKKVAIADTLAPMVENAFADPAGQSSGALLSGLYAFALQIYGDFSGYTDIARGVSRLLGFELMENFAAPYLSRNITEFWHRWHISLSSWLKDYLYISLGGNRGGALRTYRNLMLTMVLGGLWHGAGWTFVVWGSLHGAYLMLHKMLLRERRLNLAWPRSIGGWLGDLARIALTFHMVCLTWIFFRARNLADAVAYLRGIFALSDLGALAPSVLFAAGLLALLDIAQTWTGSHTWLAESPRPLRYGLGQMLLFSVLAAAVFHVHTVTPFIYFQF
jgi:alginate O-acetyltransferase complex protein AlgI